jgi:hypothetical protein
MTPTERRINLTGKVKDRLGLKAGDNLTITLWKADNVSYSFQARVSGDLRVTVPQDIAKHVEGEWGLFSLTKG